MEIKEPPDLRRSNLKIRSFRDLKQPKQAKLPLEPKERLAAIIKRFPDGVQLVKVHYVWPCFNCGSSMEIPPSTFRLLESKQLLGIKCGDCLVPPPTSGLVAA